MASILLYWLICVFVTVLLAVIANLFYKDPDHTTLIYGSFMQPFALLVAVVMVKRAFALRAWIVLCACGRGTRRAACWAWGRLFAKRAS